MCDVRWAKLTCGPPSAAMFVFAAVIERTHRRLEIPHRVFDYRTLRKKRTCVSGHHSLLEGIGTRGSAIRTSRASAAGRNTHAAVIKMEPRDVPMYPLSEHASFILDRMEPDCRYELRDLRAFVPDASVECLRELMHELWISRQVERVGHSGWRRHRSTPSDLPDPVSREVQAVKPEDLFDYATFAGFFK